MVSQHLSSEPTVRYTGCDVSSLIERAPSGTRAAYSFLQRAHLPFRKTRSISYFVPVCFAALNWQEMMKECWHYRGMLLSSMCDLSRMETASDAENPINEFLFRMNKDGTSLITYIILQSCRFPARDQESVSLSKSWDPMATSIPYRNCRDAIFRGMYECGALERRKLARTEKSGCANPPRTGEHVI